MSTPTPEIIITEMQYDIKRRGYDGAIKSLKAQKTRHINFEQKVKSLPDNHPDKEYLSTHILPSWQEIDLYAMQIDKIFGVSGSINVEVKNTFMRAYSCFNFKSKNKNKNGKRGNTKKSVMRRLR